MKPMNPPRRRVVRRRMLGGSGSAMSARALFHYGGDRIERKQCILHKYKAAGNAAVPVAQVA